MFLVTSNRTFVTGDDKGCTIVWDAQLKKKLIEVIASLKMIIFFLRSFCYWYLDRSFE
jgi:hypothetical protein